MHMCRSLQGSTETGVVLLSGNRDLKIPVVLNTLVEESHHALQ